MSQAVEYVRSGVRPRGSANSEPPGSKQVTSGEGATWRRAVGFLRTPEARSSPGFSRFCKNAQLMMPAMGSIRSNTPPEPAHQYHRLGRDARQQHQRRRHGGPPAQASLQEDPQSGRYRRRHRERQGEERRVRHDHQHVLPERLDASGAVAAEVYPRGKEERGPVVDQHAQKVDARQADGRRGQHRRPDIKRRIQIGDADERDVRDEQQPELHAGEHQGGGGGLRRDDRAAGQRVAPEQVELEEVASEIVADPLRTDHERERGPGRRQPAGDLRHRAVALERERGRGHRADDKRHDHVPCAPRADDGEQIFPEQRAAPPADRRQLKERRQTTVRERGRGRRPAARRHLAGAEQGGLGGGLLERGVRADHPYVVESEEHQGGAHRLDPFRERMGGQRSDQRPERRQQRARQRIGRRLGERVQEGCGTRRPAGRELGKRVLRAPHDPDHQRAEHRQ